VASARRSGSTGRHSLHRLTETAWRDFVSHRSRQTHDARDGQRENDVNWRRIVALAVPLAVLVFTVGVFVALELQRPPDWRLELNEFIARHTWPSETVRIEAISRARRPWNFSADMGTAEPGDWIIPSSSPEAVRCVLLVRSRRSGSGGEDESLRQVVFLAHHSDALYRVGWLAYEGPEEPFGPELMAHLESIGCDLGLE
jgi:hypothetical protein